MLKVTILSVIIINFALRNNKLYSNAFGEVPKPTKHVSSREIDISLSEGEAVLGDFYTRYATVPEVDLVFVLDRSGSVPRQGWTTINNFIYNILRHFTVDSNNTRVAIITFSSDVTVDINDLPNDDSGQKSKNDKCTLYERMKQSIETKIPYGYTGTYAALDQAYKVILDARPHAKKAVLVLTDGRSNIGPPPVRAAFNIQSLQWDPHWNESALGPQIEIYGFGIEDAYLPELNSIASDPLLNHTFLIPTFAAFETFARRLHGGKQSELWLPTEDAHCSNNCPGPNSHCMCGAHRGHYHCVCEPGYQKIGIHCTECDKGYYKDSMSLTMCVRCPDNTTTEGKASTHRDQCQLLPGLQECPDLPDIANGYAFYVPGTHKDEVVPTENPCTGVRDGNSCHYTCEEGFWMKGSPILQCNRSGLWEGQVPQCKVIDCLLPDKLGWLLPHTNIKLLNGTTTYGSMMEAVCARNLVPIGTTLWECDRHGRWTKPQNFQCAEIECPPVPRIPFMATSPSSCSQHRQPYSTECSMQCEEGFNITGEKTLTCDFGRTATWTPQPWPECTDVKPPTIICPAEAKLMVTNFGDNFTMFHIQADQALAHDNSGNFTLKVSGVPEGNVFMIGHTEIKYTAVDGSGNENSCVRDIHVMAKKAGVLYCPSSIDVIKNTAATEVDVAWKEPIFVDNMNKSIKYSCFPLGPFKVGTHTIHCTAVDYSYVKCSFKIVVKAPECEVPYTDKPPLNGALICARSGHFPHVCRIHCDMGYRLREYEHNHQFVCDWNGKWKEVESNKLVGMWPQCHKTRRAVDAKTVNEIHVAYTGSCVHNKQSISDAFIDTISKLLSRTGHACTGNGDIECDVNEVEVLCGGEKRRKKRSVDVVEEVMVRFTFFSSFNKSEDSITHRDQKKLVYKLDDMFYALEGEMEDNKFFLEINNETYPTANLTTSVYPNLVLNNCSQIAQTDTTDFKARCLSCTPGTYFTNDTCVECPARTYQDEDGQNICKDCPLNTTSSPGAFSACQCQSGEIESGEMGRNTTSDADELLHMSQCYVCTHDTPGCTAKPRCGPYCIHGDCADVGDNVTCICQDGYTGDRCDIPIPPVTGCTDVICYNGGVCKEDQLTNFTCVCPTGYTGELCEALTSKCSADTCSHGYCVDYHGNLTCICDDGWVGSNCDVEMNNCSVEICLHGNCSFDNGRVFCECFEGYIGDKCQYAENPCKNIYCENNGTCVRKDLVGFCECKPGYTGNLCELEVDVCFNYTCANNGSCFEVDGKAKCKCSSGNTGVHCEEEISNEFDLVFTTGHVDDFVSLRSISQVLDTVSACMWIRTQDVSNYGTIFSYSVENEWGNYDGVDSFCVHDYGKMQVCINGDNVVTEIAVNDGHWHHVCVLWESEQGDWSVSINNTVQASGTGLAVGTYIQPGGYLIIGQKQDTVGDGFNEREVFVGEIHQLNIYSYNITENVNISESTSCNTTAGDIMAWTDVIGHVVNDVEIRNNSMCLDVNECLINGTCPAKLVCLDTRGSYICTESLATTCLDTQCYHGGVCHIVDSKPKCQCQPLYTGEWCESLLSNVCDGVECHNEGQCIDGKCQCTLQYTGEFCENKSLPCTENQCDNGATCVSTHSDYQCICPPQWKGRHCQTFYYPSCWNRPCLNGGICIDNETSQAGYYCNCTGDNMGFNCEESACLSKPCHNGGSCIQRNDNGFICICPIGYDGTQCDIYTTTTLAPTTTTEPTTRDGCLSVECSNGGVCISAGTSFVCDCKQDYTGTYCDTKRDIHIHTYNSRVRLQIPYSDKLSSNESFKHQFELVVHSLYQPVLEDSKLKVKVNSVEQGSVLVYFEVEHTNYTDGKSPGFEEMRLVLSKIVDSGTLGPWQTSIDKFYFSPLTAPAQSSLSIWLSCIIVVLVIVFLVLVFCIYRRKRKINRQKPMRMNNLSEMVHCKIRNQTSEPGKTPPSPTVRIHSIPEDIYAEPEAFYSVTPRGSTDGNIDLQPRFPSKRGLEINETLGNRQSIPLPPRPDEKRPGLIPRCTPTPPPPAYKDAISKSLKVDNANINPGNGLQNYSPREVYYFTPLCESPKTPPVSVLTGRGKKADSVDNDKHGAGDDMYLTPRETVVKSSSDIEDSNIDTEYLTPVSKDGIVTTQSTATGPSYVNTKSIDPKSSKNVDNTYLTAVTKDNVDTEYLTPVSVAQSTNVATQGKEPTENIDIDSEYILPKISPDQSEDLVELIPSDHESEDGHEPSLPVYQNQQS